MEDRFDHLWMKRSPDATPRRTKPGFGKRIERDDPAQHARDLAVQIERTAEEAKRLEAGFDPRLLLKITLDGGSADELQGIPGVEVVSEESRRVVVAFANDEAKKEFRSRLHQIARGRGATREALLFAIGAFEGWTPDDRRGRALAVRGLPSTASFAIDVELWPLYSGARRKEFVEAFRRWCAEARVDVKDAVDQPSVLIFRVIANAATVERLLRHPDVRTVDLPPHFVLPAGVHNLAASEIRGAPAAANAGRLGVLDSGVAAGHPLLKGAVVHVETFMGGTATDEHGHGTKVAGIGAYGDLSRAAAAKTFQPTALVLSAKVLDASNRYDGKLIENQIREAVEVFVRDFQCRVFNVSFGDSNRIYLGGHVRGLSATIDALAREHDVLFVVASGNFEGGETPPADWRSEYPGYLLDESARLMEPAPALNALTVGGIAELERTRQATRYADDPAYQAIAKRDEPSPFTRCGPGPCDAIKPELVEYAGNWIVNERVGGPPGGDRDLGVLSLRHDFIGNSMFDVATGTSFAAPKVANLAARLAAEHPGRGANLWRALLVAHASAPDAAKQLLPVAEERLRLIGYGRPDERAVLASTERCVSILAEDDIAEDESHFYEVPLPADFYVTPARRKRRITLAVAHAPLVKTTRVDYRASRLEVRIACEESLAAVKRVFKHTSKEEREDLIKEPGGASPGPGTRKGGTVQAVTWEIGQVDKRWAEKKVFAVVTRTVPAWAKLLAPKERYAIVAVVEDRGEVDVRYYTQIRTELRARLRARA